MTLGRASRQLATGAGVGQIVALATTLAAARIYGPEQYGVYAYIIAIVTTLAPLSTLRFEYGIVPAESEDAKALVMLASGAALTWSVTVFLVGSAVLSGNYAGHLKVDWNEFVFIPVLLLVFAIFSILTQINVRHQRWGSLAARGALQNGMIGLFQVAIGFLRSSPRGLLLGETLGRLAGIALLAVPLGGHGFRRGAKGGPKLSTVARANKRLVVAYLPATLVDVLSASMPVILIGHWFGAASAGYLALTLKILSAPIALVGIAVGQAVQGITGSSIRGGDRDQTSLVRPLAQRLALAGVLLAGLFVLVGPVILRSLFGEDWSRSASLIPYVAGMVIVGVLFNPLSSLYVVYEAWLSFLVVSLVRIALSVGAGFVVFHAGGSMQQVIGAMVVAIVAVDLAGSLYAVRLSRG